MTSEFSVQDRIVGRRNRFLKEKKKLQAKVNSVVRCLVISASRILYNNFDHTHFLSSKLFPDLYPLSFPPNFFPHQSLLVLSQYSKMCGLLLECDQLIVAILLEKTEISSPNRKELSEFLQLGVALCDQLASPCWDFVLFRFA